MQVIGFGNDQEDKSEPLIFCRYLRGYSHDSDGDRDTLHQNEK